MRVVLVEPGGYAATFQYCQNLCEAIAAEGHELLFLTGVRYEARDFPRQFEVAEVFDRLLPRPAALARALGRVRRLRPDVVHIVGHSHPTSYLALWSALCAMRPAPLVYTAQDIRPKKYRPHHGLALRLLYRAAREILVHSESNASLLRDDFRVPAGRITTLPLAFDLLAFARHIKAPQHPMVPAGRKVVLFFGNIEPRKGLLELVAAFAEVHRRVPEAYLLIAGKAFDAVGPYADAVRTSPAAGSIGFHPNYLDMHEVAGVLPYVDLIAIPYLWGYGSGLVGTAHAFGKPVVATDLPAVREIIRDGETALLVPPGDVPRLADAITRVLTEPGLAERLRAGGDEVARQNSWAAIARATAQAYARATKR